MKKITLLVIAMLLVSVGAFAQQDFGKGGYAGPVLEPILVQDLMTATPNQHVIVEGFVIQERVPGMYILADDFDAPEFTVLVKFNPYVWVNLEITDDTPVLVYGIVNRSEMRIEIEAYRIEIIE